jgi:large subunit ribosomal protein L4e
MKTEILSIEGKKIKEIELPSVFSVKVREDIIKKIFEAEKKIQPYGPDPKAGRQSSASGRIRHIRHKWRTAYGKGISRIPRKTMWRRGTQFYWVGAEVSGTRGGRRAHPPKMIHFLEEKKINKKEKTLALKSAISSTSHSEFLSQRYSKINETKIKLPIVVESKISGLKTKDLFTSLKKILGEMFVVAKKSESIRCGKGKARNRKNKKTQGALIITGNDEKIKTSVLDSKKVKDLEIKDLYPVGRIVVYTEDSIKDLEALK